MNRNFTAERSNQKWVVDISYIWTQEGWLYLAVVLDLHSRRVIGPYRRFYENHLPIAPSHGLQGQTTAGQRDRAFHAREGAMRGL